MEKPESSSLDVRLELAREPRRLDCAGLWGGKGVAVTALAMAVIEAGSFSGGEAFHLSRGLRSATSTLIALCRISMAPSIGDAGPEAGLTLPLRRALASQFEI